MLNDQLNQNSETQTNQNSQGWHSYLPSFSLSPKFKLASMATIAMVNGLLYGTTIPEQGGRNLENFFGIEGPGATGIVYGLSAASGLAYTMFYYKTLDGLKFNINSFQQIFFSCLAPFAALPFLSGGVEGAKKLLPAEIAIGIGVTLFIFRMVCCVDASIKFPDRFTEIKSSWDKAWERKDYKELTRLIVTALTSLGYAICATDSIYAAVQIVLAWFYMEKNAVVIASYIISGIGAVGILPLTLYWIHRGLKQLTFGGEANSRGETADPTDKYTAGGFALGLPNILGILGAVTSDKGAVFGQLGKFAEITRITSSVVYGVSSTTPGLATLLRAAFKSCTPQEHFLVNVTEKEPLIQQDSASYGGLNKRGIFKVGQDISSPNGDTTIKMDQGNTEIKFT